ncbi:MAG TPA: polymer-forming cytoskeletal protein [Mucilaginibacter sp.]|jgi:cytoskeletal protein CcmA (bactofilin family)|nr:polymer-forming cytoskeletal protein [Mucilaginibacter sp.]
MNLINYIKSLFLKEEKQPVSQDDLLANGSLIQKDKDIIAVNDVWIAQNLTGNIYGGRDITVCKDAVITGDVNCRKCVVEGRIEGNISVSDTLEIRAGAILNGNIVAKKLDVNPEAILNGNITIVKDGKPIYADIKLKIANFNQQKPEKEAPVKAEPIFEIHKPAPVQNDPREKNPAREAPAQIQNEPEHAEIPKVAVRPEKPKADPEENNSKWW